MAASVNSLIIFIVVEKAELSCNLVYHLLLALACIGVEVLLLRCLFSRLLFRCAVFRLLFGLLCRLKLLYALRLPVGYALAFGLESLYAYKLFGLNLHRAAEGVAMQAG